LIWPDSRLSGEARSRERPAKEYDRRGFGKPSQPTPGYNYDTFTEDLHKLVTHLELRDFALVGLSMGGGEVARHFGKYGAKGVSKAVFISSVPPFLLKTPDNPEGVDGSVFEGIQKAVAADRYAFFTEFFKNFYNTDLLLGKRVSEQAIQANWNVTASASATASLACVPRLMPAWQQMAGPPTAVALYQLLPSGLSSNRAEFPS